MRGCPEAQRTGTTAAAPEGGLSVHGGPYEQTVFVLQRIEDALQQLGAELGDVVRTRMYVTDIGQWESKSKPMLFWEIAK